LKKKKKKKKKRTNSQEGEQEEVHCWGVVATTTWIIPRSGAVHARYESAQRAACCSWQEKISFFIVPTIETVLKGGERMRVGLGDKPCSIPGESCAQK